MSVPEFPHLLDTQVAEVFTAHCACHRVSQIVFAQFEASAHKYVHTQQVFSLQLSLFLSLSPKWCLHLDSIWSMTI